jgi:phenylalanyl-tRNA synthetase beta chain
MHIITWRIFVTGEVLSVAPHPDADRLRVAQVEIGKYTVRQIVCGAPNLEAGQKVAVALPGAFLPNGSWLYKESEIRGVQSEGMLCSEKELGLSENHEGIAVLHEEAPIGAEFAKYIGLARHNSRCENLADRGSDALSYEGLAREIAALDGHAPQFIEVRAKPLKVPAYNRAPKIHILDKKECRRYVGLYFKDVVVGESPFWMKTRLLVSGLRPVNNIVDITNYLMLLDWTAASTRLMLISFRGELRFAWRRRENVWSLLDGEKRKTLTAQDLGHCGYEKSIGTWLV